MNSRITYKTLNLFSTVNNTDTVIVFVEMY